MFDLNDVPLFDLTDFGQFYDTQDAEHDIGALRETDLEIISGLLQVQR